MYSCVVLTLEALTPSPSKCEIVKEKSGDITLRQIGVKSYEDASKEEGRRRLEEVSADGKQDLINQ